MVSMPSVEFDDTAIVILGLFNPAILTPDWLLHEKLISVTQSKLVDLDVISPDVTNMRVGSLSLNVTRERLQIQTADISDAERVRDLALGIGSALRHTPVGALGINRSLHVPSEDEDLYHRLGDALMPKDFWNSLLHLPGLRQSTLWGARRDGYQGREQLAVEPSMRTRYGFFMHYNDHFLPSRQPSPTDRNDQNFTNQPVQIAPEPGKMPIVLSILAEEWTASLNRAHHYFESIWKFASGAPTS